MLTVFDAMIVYMLRDKTLGTKAKELFVCQKMKHFYCFHYTVCSKNITLNPTYYFIIKIPNKYELQ